MAVLSKIRGLLYNVFVTPYYRVSMGRFGRNSKLFKPTGITGYQRIFIGDNVFISHYGWLAANPLTGDMNCKLTIGDGTYIGRFCHIYSTSAIEIGKKVLIADKVYISDNLHGHAAVDIPVIDQPVVQANKVVIGDGSWLGENVCVIGASVGKHSIVGANAVVNKDIPDYCIAVGIPAKIIKRYNFEANSWQKTNESGEFL